MQAFEVYLNGERLCTAGIGEKNAVLSTIISRTGRKGKNNLFLHVGGLDPATGDHFRWLGDHLKLRVGGEVRVKIVETDSVDMPQRRIRTDDSI